MPKVFVQTPCRLQYVPLPEIFNEVKALRVRCVRVDFGETRGAMVIKMRRSNPSGCRAIFVHFIWRMPNSRGRVLRSGCVVLMDANFCDKRGGGAFDSVLVTQGQSAGMMLSKSRVHWKFRSYA